MKWVSKLSFMVAGAVLAASASRPVAAYPAIRMGGPDAVLTAPASECDVDAFRALLANPSAADDAAALRLSALKAMGLGGLSGFGELTACQVDAGAALALDNENSNRDALLLQGEAAQDMIAALLGLPIVGLDALAPVDEVTASAEEANFDLSLASVADLNLDEALAELRDTEVTDDSITTDNTNLASSFGSGGGGGGGGGGGLLSYTGGGWYGGAKNWYGGNVGGTSGGNHHAAGSSHKGKHHTANPASVGGGNPTVTRPAIGYNGQVISGDVGGTVVPLPSAAWSGLFLIAILVATRKTRLARAILA